MDIQELISYRASLGLASNYYGSAVADPEGTNPDMPIQIFSPFRLRLSEETYQLGLLLSLWAGYLSNRRDAHIAMQVITQPIY